MWFRLPVKSLLMGLVVVMSGCSGLPSRTVEPSPQVQATQQSAEQLKAKALERCEAELRAFSSNMTQKNFDAARGHALALFTDANCPSKMTYSPVWSMLDISRDDKFIRSYIAHARKSSLAEDSSLEGQVARGFLTAVELYLTGSHTDDANAALQTVESQLGKGAYSSSPALQELARAQVLFLYGVIADLKTEQAAFDACVAYWNNPEAWTPQELKTGLYYQLASRIQKALSRIWTGLNDMQARRTSASDGTGAAFDPLETVVSPKLFEARVLIDELFYEYSKPDYQPIVEEFRMELLPELALKGVNDIIDAYYTKTDNYKGQFQSGTAYLSRAREISEPFLSDVRRRIAKSSHSACASQFQ